jgi:hypothetical protein
MPDTQGQDNTDGVRTFLLQHRLTQNDHAADLPPVRVRQRIYFVRTQQAICLHRSFQCHNLGYLFRKPFYFVHAVEESDCTVTGIASRTNDLYTTKNNKAIMIKKSQRLDKQYDGSFKECLRVTKGFNVSWVESYHG